MKKTRTSRATALSMAFMLFSAAIAAQVVEPQPKTPASPPPLAEVSHAKPDAPPVVEKRGELKKGGPSRLQERLRSGEGLPKRRSNRPAFRKFE